MPGFREEWDKLALKDHDSSWALMPGALAAATCIPAAGGTWPGPALGQKCQVLEGHAVCAAALCALSSFSPSHAVLGQGELLWGVTGGSGLRVMLAKSCGAAAAGGES